MCISPMFLPIPGEAPQLHLSTDIINGLEYYWYLKLALSQFLDSRPDIEAVVKAMRDGDADKVFQFGFTDVNQVE